MAKIKFCTVILNAMSSQSQNGKVLSPDEFAVQQLKKFNLKFDKPQVVEFFFYFPTKALARKAGKEIIDEGCDSTIELGAGKDAQLCFATKEIVKLPNEI